MPMVAEKKKNKPILKMKKKKDASSFHFLHGTLYYQVFQQSISLKFV